jgi:proteasome lid subunit RPN8/RPN11
MKKVVEECKARPWREGAAARESGAPVEPTEYAKNRPRRDAAVVSSGAFFRDAGGGNLDLHPMRHFAPSAPGGGGAGAQPFKVTCTPSALLIMDLHAHLCTNEVIGYLGGRWDPLTRTIAVERAFPGRGIASGQDVEMDPVAEVELKAQVEAQRLTVVGWYHSHPVFEPVPSGVDIVNQLNYQSLFRDEAAGAEPFVGFIVGPYDLRLPTQVSAVTCFMAQRRRRRDSEEDVPCEAWGAPLTGSPPSQLTAQLQTR